MASGAQPSQSQMCSSCTLGSKSQWTQVYFITLIVAWCLYLIKTVLDVLRNAPHSSNGITINLVVSLTALIVSFVVISSASADDSDCANADDRKQYHKNASFLLVSLCLGYFSLISAMYSPTNESSRPFFVMSITIIFCLIFLVYAAASKNKSLYTCNQFSFNDTFKNTSSPSSSESSFTHACTQDIVQMCNQSARSRCNNQMKKHNHKAFSIEYNSASSAPSTITTVTCNTYDKTPSSVDIELVEVESTNDNEDSEGLGDTSSNPSCLASNNQSSIYYESELVNVSDKKFLLNMSITSLFAAIAFLRPMLLTGRPIFIGGGGLNFNVFSCIAIMQMFMFFYIATGYYSSSGGEV